MFSKGVVYVVFLLLSCLLESAFSSQEMAIFMETDVGYVVPTAVAMYSAEQNCSRPLNFLVFITDEVAQSRSLCQLLRGVRREGDFVRLIDMDTLISSSVHGLMGELRKSVNVNKSTDPKFIAFRILLQTILETGDPFFVLNEEGEEEEYFSDIKHFLWLDSDLVVLKDLAPLYELCLKSEQPIVSSDLSLFLEEASHPRTLREVLRKDGVHEGDVKKISPPLGLEGSRISGGVVFWNLDCFPEVEGSQESAMVVCFRKSIRNRTEEGAMDTLLSELYEDVTFFSTIYNCRSYCLENEADIQRVAVIHWDSEPKPWTLAKEKMGIRNGYGCRSFTLY